MDEFLVVEDMVLGLRYLIRHIQIFSRDRINMLPDQPIAEQLSIDSIP